MSLYEVIFPSANESSTTRMCLCILSFVYIKVIRRSSSVYCSMEVIYNAHAVQRTRKMPQTLGTSFCANVLGAQIAPRGVVALAAVRHSTATHRHRYITFIKSVYACVYVYIYSMCVGVQSAVHVKS